VRRGGIGYDLRRDGEKIWEAVCCKRRKEKRRKGKRSESWRQQARMNRNFVYSRSRTKMEWNEGTRREDETRMC
jgi:hypothetical protein